MIYTEPTELNDYLDTGERLLWTGKPKPGIIFKKADIFMIPFSLLWCGGVIFGFISTYKTGGIFTLFFIPFLVMGLFIVFGRFIIEKKQREKTLYGITEDRILIRSGLFSRKTDSINIKTLMNLEFTEKSDRSGTIRLGPKHPQDPFGMNENMSWMPGAKSTPSIAEIENVREVYKLITKIQKAE